MVLSIGIVVDDAIVVLENVERHMREDGLTARDAAIKAMREVTSPIVAIVLTLTAVFVPIAFLGGLTGELYRQFAVTISISVVISGLVALTLSPALCALILKPHVQPNRFFAAFNRGFAHVTAHYTDGVVWMLRRGTLGAVLFLGMVALTIGLWRITPGSLVPDEDQGFYITVVILPDGATLERTFKVVNQVEAAIRSNPNNQDIIAFTGFDFVGGTFRNNAATIFVTQKPWEERTVTAAQLAGELFGKTAGIKEAEYLPSTHRRSLAWVSRADSSSTSRIVATAVPSGCSTSRRRFSPRRTAIRSWRTRRPCGAPRSRSSRSTSTATRRRRWACRFRMSTARYPPRSAPTTSTISTNTAAPGRC